MIYSPREDSYLLEKEVKRYAKDKKVLDLGAGSGIQAESALKEGVKSVLCADIDFKVVEFLRKKGLNVIQSDLFSNIKGKFELIIFNPPYLPADESDNKESRVQTTGGRRGDEIIVRFLEDVKNYLSEEGIILIVISSLTPRDRILRVLKEKGLKKEVISKEDFFMESLEVWKIVNEEH